MLNMIKRACDLARLQSIKVAIIAMSEQAIASVLTEPFLSERYPKVNWPRTWVIAIVASSAAPCVELRPIEEA